MKQYIFTILIILTCISTAHAQTVAEKKAGLGQAYIGGGGDLTEEMRTSLAQTNQELESLDRQLKVLHQRAMELFRKNASSAEYKDLLTQIRDIRQRRAAIQTQWRDMATQEQSEGYALWYQPNTTIEQLVIDYGAQDFVYLIPSDIADIPLSVNSNLPIPRATWGEMLELILVQSGIGVKQLNPFLRELYILKEDRSNIKLITSNRRDLEPLPNDARIVFMLSPEPADVRRTWIFLERFVNPLSVVLQQIGRDILIVAQVSEVRELLKIYDFIAANRGDKEYRIMPLMRVDAQEMAKILNAVFGVLSDEPTQQGPEMHAVRQVGRPQPRVVAFPGESSNPPPDNGLQVIPLAQVARAVFLVGTREEIRKAEKIIREVEDQVGEAHGKVINWYTVKNSDPEELAEVLYSIYNLMISRRVGIVPNGKGMPNTGGPGHAQNQNINNRDDVRVNVTTPPPIVPIVEPRGDGFYLDDSYVVNRRPPPEERKINDRDNFIVDLKTGAIVMVVEADILPRMKDLIRKLDVPKKMVQIEVLLFEKKLNRDTNFGLNLLKIGSNASNSCRSGTSFNTNRVSDDSPSIPRGIFDFLISRERSCGIPAFDLMYRFLLSQEDVHINASPSVLAVNQTPAIIEITDEISVNTGFYTADTVARVAPVKDTFARAQYGIKIEITPTIHIQTDEEYWIDEPDYVTLNTDIMFQTIKPSLDNRPDVTTRHIVNEVRVCDGQTVILGGLRQRSTRDGVARIPFLGDLPGVGKLFSLTDLHEDTTEMFIFITPKIIYDACEDLERVKMRELCRRPGDVPSFLCCLLAAQECEKHRLFESTLTILLGQKTDRGLCAPGEYDGR